MENVHLTVAISKFDHVRDFVTGEIKAEGIDITHLNLVHEEIFYRFLKYSEWDVSEISFAKYVALISQGDESMMAIPVFHSRAFRLSSFYVHRDGKIKKPEDLAGKKIGIPEWAQTASVYTRGYLMHQIGIPLQDIDWYQAGVNEPGRTEKVALKIPPGVRYTQVSDRSLTELLLAKDVDAVLSARPPQYFLDGNPEIVRLFPDFLTAEEAYWRETKIFPIMHAVVIRADILKRYPWVAMNLFKAFEEAKRRSIQRALDFSASRFPIPWSSEYANRAVKIFGPDYWPYGIEPNRVTLESFLQYAYEQGVCHRHLKPEELFPKTVQSSYRI
ncbi:MAG: 4,5-dihydroxyphthalate decarboxylase [Deltaproteobacteria bacterium]|nr:4,5-dihydroxyphthalate decarboxylase [Deltaproteobacteria bacterium]